MHICLETRINASPQVCFDLSRNIDLHKHSMQHTGERAVAGVTSGLIGPGEFVTWEARHFGITMQLTTRITEFKWPEIFVDEQLKGPFSRLHHAHIFEPADGGTLMIDEFECELPFGILGQLVDRLVMKRYMTNLLSQRNQIIKKAATSG